MKGFALTIVFILHLLLPLYSQKDEFSKPYNDSLPIYIYKQKAINWQTINADSTFFYAKKYLQESKSKNSIDDIINATIILTNFLHTQSNYTDEIEVLLEAVKLLDDEKFIVTKADFLYKMGEASRAARKFKSGMKYLTEAEKIYKANNKELKLAKTYNRKAAILFKLLFDDMKQVFVYADKSMKIAKKFHDYELIASNLDIKGATYTYLKEHEKALYYFYEVIEILKKNGKEPFVNVYINICVLNYNLKNYSESIKYGERAVKVLGEHGNKPQLETVTDFLSKSYYRLGNYKKAHDYLKLSQNFKNIQFNVKRNAKIAELNKKYQTEKKEIELEKQQKLIEYNKLELKQKQIQNIILLVGILFVAVILFIVYKQSRKTVKWNKQLTDKNEKIKHQSQELIFKNNKLMQLGRFKESMTSMLVHDLKNPINVIIGNAHDFKNNKNALLVNDAASKMLVLILNLLDVEKYENTTMKISSSKFKIQKLIDNTYKQIRHSLKIKNIRFQLNITANYMLYADINIIERVLVNLLTNAIKFTPQNGKIILSAKPIDEELLRISIVDSGPGINENLHKSIFEKYIQIDNSYQTQASGLGLAFCKIATERHGGSIYLQKNRKEGAEFIFSLPYIVEESTKSAYIINEDIESTNDIKEKIIINSKDKIKLNPFIAELKELDVSCITDVKKILDDINILKLKISKEIFKRINLSLKSCNQNMYDSILEELSDT